MYNKNMPELVSGSGEEQNRIKNLFFFKTEQDGQPINAPGYHVRHSISSFVFSTWSVFSSA